MTDDRGRVGPPKSRPGPSALDPRFVNDNGQLAIPFPARGETPLPITSHPTRWSREVLDALAPLIDGQGWVHDCYGGDGTRLGALCDQLDVVFTAGDLEDWPGRDRRVIPGLDAELASSYPDGDWVMVTSPTYQNKRFASYPDGPRPRTQLRGRREYAFGLGTPLHRDNLARLNGRPSGDAEYWRRSAATVKHWRSVALVNVDEPISDRWEEILVAAGFIINETRSAYTSRYGGLDNATDRAEREVVIVAMR